MMHSSWQVTSGSNLLILSAVEMACCNSATDDKSPAPYTLNVPSTCRHSPNSTVKKYSCFFLQFAWRLLIKWTEIRFKIEIEREKHKNLLLPIYQCHYQMRPMMPSQFLAKTVQNWDLPTMAYGQAAHGNNLALVYKMDPKSVEYIACNGIHEMLSRIENPVAINSQPLVAIEIRFFASKSCSHLATAANCLRDSHSISPIVANFPCTLEPHTMYTIDAAHEIRCPCRILSREICFIWMSFETINVSNENVNFKEMKCFFGHSFHEFNIFEISHCNALLVDENIRCKESWIL